MKLSEYVTQVINDPKCGRDAEWVRLNLRREHLERIEAARDAEVRAGVVAEEPEWKTEYAARTQSGHLVPTDERGACYAGETPMERRVTPWVPVKQEGDGR